MPDNRHEQFDPLAFLAEAGIGRRGLHLKAKSVIFSQGDKADAVEKYLSNHPNKLNEREVVLARKALSKAYPCGGFRQ